MPQELPEMIQLLITETRKVRRRSFITVMNQFIERMPVIHSTNKEEFFIAYFLGGVYNFQYTQLKTDLQVTASFWKWDSREHTLDFVFEISDRDNSNKHLIFRSITAFNKESPYGGRSANRWPYSSLVFKDAMLTKVAYKNSDNTGGLSFKGKILGLHPITQLNTDSSGESERKLLEFGFEKIQLESDIKGINEGEVQKFSLDAAQVKEAVESYLLGNVELSQKLKSTFKAQAEKNPNLSDHENTDFNEIMQKVSTEAFSHGFLYGSLSLNFKNRYRMDCYVERIGGNGYTDLMMISRANGRRSNSIPIIIELKTGKVRPKDAITQIENKGYFQHELSVRTYSPIAIIVGLNYNLADEEPRAEREQRTTRGDIIAVREVQIPTKNDVMGQILKTSIDDLSDHEERQGKIKKNLMDLYYSHFGGLNFRSFLSLLTGHVISYNSAASSDQNNNLNNFVEDKKSFLLPNDLSRDQFAMLVIDTQEQGLKKTIVFELNAAIERNTRSHTESSLPEALAWLVSQRRNQQAELHKISIKIDAGKTGTDFFSSIVLERVALPAFDVGRSIIPLKTGFHELKTLFFSDFFETDDAGLFGFSSTLKDKVQETLFPLRSLFQGEVRGQQKESVFQAVMQGMIAGFNRETRRVRTFVEPNYSAQGRADLVVALPSFGEQEKLIAESLFIFEFKSLHSTTLSTTKANQALAQAQKYVDNLKSLTDARTVKLMGLVMNSQAKEEQYFLAGVSDSNTVDHISSDERSSSPERAPNKRNRVNPLESSSEEENTPKRRCQRSVGTSCFIDLTQDSDESTLITDLAEARQRGHVILLADSYALLLALVKVNNPIGKIFLLDENLERLNRVFQMLVQAQNYETIETYLQTIQLSFPKATRVLEEGIAQLDDSIDFGQFKNMLVDNQLVLIKMNGFFHHQEGLRQHLGVGSEGIAAIYVGDYEYRGIGWESSENALKEGLLSLLSPEDRTGLYRKILSGNNPQISVYSGSKDYLEQAWQPVKQSFFRFDYHDESLHLLKSVDNWYSSIKQSSIFNKDWIPILETAQEGISDNEQIHFLHRDTYESRIVELDGISSVILRENLNLLYGSMKDATAFKKSIPESLGDPTENIESVDGLNIAFAVQAVFDFVKAKDRAQFQTEQGPLYTAMEVHHYFNLAQMAHGTAMDVNKVVDIVKTLLSEEVILAEKPLSLLQLGLRQGAGEGLGVLFGVVNVILDSIELNEARTAQEKATFSAQLGLDIGGLTLPVASMGAAYVGAATAASALGAASVIFSGLAIGTMALVQAFGAVAARAEAVGSYFSRLDDAYRRKGYTNQSFLQDNQSFMTPIYGALVKEINFINGTVSYGSQYIYSASFPGLGSGKINYLLWFGTTPFVSSDKKLALNIRERLGYPENMKLGDWKTVPTWILPSTPIIYLRYDWTALPFATSRHDAGFSILRRLEEQGDFHYDFYVFPAHQIIDALRQEIVTTLIQIILNEQERTLVVPSFSDHDNNIYDNLHYQIKAPAIPGRCSIVLNRMGSLTLLSQHQNYTWTLITEHFSVDRLRLTETGIEIANALFINIASPHNGKYLFVDKDLFVFAIDWPMNRLLLKELHFPFFKNDFHALESYVESKFVNPPIKLSGFPIHDHQKALYNGTAYYSAQEDPYIYTKGIPKSINEPGDLIGCWDDACYFLARPDLFWRSNLRTHQLEEKYLFYSKIFIEFSTNEKSVDNEKAQLESAVLEKDGRLTSIRVFKNEQEKIIQKAHYDLIQDKLILSAIDSDQLSQIFIDTRNEGELAIYLSKVFNQKPNSISAWDEYPEILGRALLAEMGPCIKIRSLSKAVHSSPVWLRRKNNQRHQLINPHVEEAQLTFLGSLPAADGSEVFYFYLPAQNQSSAQLFRQAEQMAPAIPLDLSITHAYFSKEMLFILTPENIIKKLNVLGETSIVGINTAWTQAHASDWWEKIPALLIAENHSGKDPIRLYGLNNHAGKALAVWYNPVQRSFAMMYPPMKSTGESFPVSYLVRAAGLDFFFSDNGVLYRQTAFSGVISTCFQGTQLQQTLPPLVVLADSLQAAYFHQERLWFNQKGAIFSLNPTLPWLVYLEKIAFTWFEGEPMDEPFLSNKVRFIQAFKSKFKGSYERSDLFRNDFSFSKVNFSDETLFITYRKKSLIPIRVSEDENLWWNPNEDSFFYNPFKEDISDWRYLGVCSDLHNVAGVCFFSPKAKMLYFNPNYQDYQGEPFYADAKIATELAMSHQDVFLCVFDQVPPSPLAFFPLFRDKKNLNLYISSESAYTFDVPQILLNHYQVSFYQSFSLAKKTLTFPFNGEMEYKKSGRDIIFFSSAVTGQWTFLEGMQDETWNRTSFDITRYYRWPVYFLLKKARECLLHRNEENIDINGLFFLAGSCLWFERPEDLLPNSDSPHYAHQSRYHHAIESPPFVEKRLKTFEKTAEETSTVLIISSLSALLGVVVGGVYCLFTRRLRQNNPPAALPLAAAAIPLLPLGAASSVPAIEANSMVHCRKDFFKQAECLQNESSIGLLGYCNNGREALLWLISKRDPSGEVRDLLWYMLGHPKELPASNNASLNWELTSVKVSGDSLYFNPDRSCRQTIDLRKIQPVSMASLFFYLPSKVQKWLQAWWSHEKVLQDKVLQDKAASQLFQQLARSVGLNYFASECLLHTSVGDFFQLFGLRPNWQDQDHRYYFTRCLRAGQQLFFGDPNKTNPIMTIASVGLETALLHPKLQAKYFSVSCKNSHYAKQAVRFVADLLQFGSTNFAYLPSVLEFLFSDYAPISMITLGLRTALSLFSINNDLSYYYLGMALFLLPQLPLLLEHLGIPVTRYVSQTLKKLTQFFTVQSLIASLAIKPDEDRLAEQERTLSLAEQRVTKGQDRLNCISTRITDFFNPTTPVNVDVEVSLLPQEIMRC